MNLIPLAQYYLCFQFLESDFFLKHHHLYQQKMGTVDDLNYFHTEFRISHCSWYANTADAL